MALPPLSGELPETDKLLDKKDTITLKRCIYSAQVSILDVKLVV